MNLSRIVCVVAVLLLSSFVLASPTTRPVRLFILSGQSNMKGLDPAVSFTPAVTKAFPDEEVIVVKFAQSGQLIRMWDKAWQAPAGTEPAGQGKNGKHYESLMATVTRAMAGKPAPVSITFVWMQGEADANHKGYAELYADALKRLIGQLQTDLGRQDLDIVIGRISDFGNNSPDERPGWNQIRQIQVDFAEHHPRGGWVDTDDLNGKSNGLHYGAEGYRQLGERFAAKAIELIKSPKKASTTKP